MLNRIAKEAVQVSFFLPKPNYGDSRSYTTPYSTACKPKHYNLYKYINIYKSIGRDGKAVCERQV